MRHETEITAIWVRRGKNCASSSLFSYVKDNYHRIRKFNSIEAVETLNKNVILSKNGLWVQIPSSILEQISTDQTCQNFDSLYSSYRSNPSILF